MATATEPLAPAVSFEDHPFEITSDVFFSMVEAGLFPRDCQVYLWGGRVYEKMAKTVPHATTAVRVHEALRARLPGGWLIWPKNSIRLDARHAPLPDITVIRGPLDRFDRENRHPDAADIGLLIEIAASSLPKDLGERAEKFARALLPVYWVADVIGRRVVEHTEPQIIEGVGRYANVRSLERGDEVRLVLDGLDISRIPVDEMLP